MSLFLSTQSNGTDLGADDIRDPEVTCLQILVGSWGGGMIISCRAENQGCLDQYGAITSISALSALILRISLSRIRVQGEGIQRSLRPGGCMCICGFCFGVIIPCEKPLQLVILT